MQKKYFIFGSIISICLIISAASYFIVLKNETNASPPSDLLVECNSLTSNEGGINILFFSDEETTKKYSEKFFSSLPFVNHQEKFNFFYITPDQYNPICEDYQGIAIYCYSKDLLKRAASCPYDYITVLKSEPNSKRSSAYKGVMSLNSEHPTSVFLHEFGHVFANFAEEYMTSASLPRGQKNCVQNCEFNEFEGEFECYEGCTKDSYDREEKSGIMRTLQSDRYGDYDEMLLEEEINNQYTPTASILTGSAISDYQDCKEKQYILAQGTIQDNEVKINSKELLPGCTPIPKKSGKYKYEVTSSNQILLEGYFEEEYVFNTDLTEGEITAEPLDARDDFILTIPATGEEETLIIKDEDGNTLAETDLTIGARPCKT